MVIMLCHVRVFSNGIDDFLKGRVEDGKRSGCPVVTRIEVNVQKVNEIVPKYRCLSI